MNDIYLIVELDKSILYDWLAFEVVEDEEKYLEYEKVIGKVHQNKLDCYGDYDTDIYLVVNGKEEPYLDYEIIYEHAKNSGYILNEREVK